MAVSNYAHITNGVVDNVIVLDPDTKADYPMDGLVKIDENGVQPGVGWSYSGGTFTPPAPEPAPTDTSESSGTTN